MTGDKICFNGRICGQASISAELNELLSFNYIYQDLHAFNRRVVMLERHIELLCGSFEQIHGRKVTIDKDHFEKCIATLLDENKYLCPSVMLRLYMTIEGWFVTCIHPLLYEGFTLWHSRIKAYSVQYEIPFSGHMCGVALMAARTAKEFARRNGGETAIHESYDGVLLDCACYPVAAVRDGSVYISPTDFGAADGIWRDLLFEACEYASVPISELPLNKKERFDEMFAFTPQGITSMKSFNDDMLFHSVTIRISESLHKILR